MRLFSNLRQKIEIERVITIFKESILTPVTTLGYMVRDAKKDEAWDASHGDV